MLVSIPARAGFLAVAAKLIEPIHDLGLRPLRPRLAHRFQMLPDTRADVDTGQVLHRERPHRHAEAGQRLVDLQRGSPFLE